MAETPPNGSAIEAHIQAIKDGGTAAVDAAVVLAGEVKTLTVDQLTRLRTSVAALKVKENIGIATSQALDVLQKNMDALGGLPKVVDLSNARAAVGEVPVVSDVARGALHAAETTANLSAEGYKKWEEFTKENPKAGVAVAGGVMAGGAVLLYGAYHMLKNIWSTVADGTKKAAEWVADHKWTILTLGLAGGGMYALGKKPSKDTKPKAPEKPAEPLKGTSILGKEETMQIKGKNHKVLLEPTGAIVLDGKKWNIVGKGIASAASFTIVQAAREANGSVALEIQGSALGMEKKENHHMTKAQLEELLTQLQDNKPPSIPVKVKAPFIGETTIEITLAA